MTGRAGGFRHEALFYQGDQDFTGRTAPFIRDGVRAGEPILVVVSARKIEILRTALGQDARTVRFADMDHVGRNPARIIPAWRDFVVEHAEYTERGGSLRGIGEPIWASRSPDEMAECQRHEALLNLAFADSPPWWLVCPYDTTSLREGVLEEAHRNHEFVRSGDGVSSSATFRSLDAVAMPFDDPLPEPDAPPATLTFRPSDLRRVRGFVREQGRVLGLTDSRTKDLVLAANELATNSIRHAQGHGTVRMWRQGDSLVCEISDDGRIGDPLVGRHRPAPGQLSGFGMWLVNELCDLVQVRTFPTGSVIRLHVSSGAPSAPR